VLDALPSSYDFPALANSIEKLIASQGLEIVSIAGTDDEVAQSENQVSDSPLPVEVPFQTSVNGNYAGIQNLISTFERSIRPVQIQSLTLNAADGDVIAMTIGAQTFYQPAKSLNIKTEVIK
jgi:Tfp pilus assembly protein PilO